MSVQAANYWLDVNGTTSGSGVANGGSYDWTAANWGDFAGTATPVVWPGGSNQAFMNGAGPSTSYTVRLGATGSTNVTLQNFAININSAANGGSGNGDVVIGNPGDTGILTLNATNSVGAQNGGVLTVNNGINLNAFTLNLRGGDVVFNGVVSGTGASRIALGGTALGFTTGPGTLTLANTANTYAGRLNSDYIGANFTLAVTKLANGGSNSSIGTSSANIGVNGGTLKYIGSTGAQTTNLGFHMASGGTNVDASGVGSGDTIEFSGAPTYSAVNSARALTLTGANDGDNTIAFVYGNNGSGVNTLTKSGSGKWVLNQANSYTGVTTIGGGVLNVATLSNYSTSGALGARTAAQEAAGDIGLRFLGGTLQYTGATAQSTDRQIRIGTAGATLDASGSAPSATMSFTYSGANTDLFDSTGTRTLTLTGSNTGNNTFAIKLEDQGGNATSLTKSGSGKWVLTNTNTHTGGNTINGGTLAISGDGQLGAVPGSPVANSIIFNNGGKLSVSTSGATLNVNRGITLTGDGTLEATGTNNLVYRGKITGPGVFTLSMPGSTEGQFGSAASDYSGGTILTSGSKFVIFDDSTGSASTANLTAGAFGTGPITMNNLNIRTTTSGAKTVGNAITLQGNLTMHAPGTGTSQNLTFNGPVTLVGGTRTLANSGNSNAALLTLSGVISDGGMGYGLTMASTAGRSIVLSGANTYTGTTTITGGRLVAANPAALGPAGNTVTFSASSTTLDLATDTSANAYIINLASGNTSTIELNRATSGAAITHTMGIPTLGNGTLNVMAGSNVSSGTPTLVFPSITLSAGVTGLGTMTLNPTTANITVNGGISRPGVSANSLTLSGTSTGNTVTGPVSGALALVKNGTGTWELSGANTYTGSTTVSSGTLILSGARTGSSGGITVSDTAGVDATLDIEAGTHALGANDFAVGHAVTTPATGTVNQSGGAVTFTGANQLLIGRGSGSGATGIYNLSGGSITTSASTSRGIMVGVHNNSTAQFNLSGTGVLNMTAASGGGGDAVLQIGRFDFSGQNNQTAGFTQTGGTANVGILSIGGTGTIGTGHVSTLTLTAGVFSANQFSLLAAGNSNTAEINIGGTADVTLPAFPTTRGTGSSATINFDGGTLRPLAASATYMSGLTAAYVKAGGVKFDVAGAKDITIAQDLVSHGVSTGGGLIKSGAGELTLTGANTYTGTTHIAGGTLVVASGNQMGAAPGAYVANNITFSNGAELRVTSAGTPFGATRGITMLGDGTLSSVSTHLIYRGKVTGAGQLTLDLPGSTESQWGLNTSDYAGGTILTPDTKLVIFNNSVGSASTANLTSGAFGTGVLTINDGVNIRATQNNAVTIGNAITWQGNLTIGSAQTQLLTFTGPVTITGSTRTITTNASGTTKFTGVFSQASAGLGLTKAGTGEVILSGSNTYTGVTTVSGGVLRIENANALPGGIGVSGGTSALTFNGGVIGLNSGDFTRNLASAGTVTGVNFTGAGGWAGYGATRVVNLNNDSHAVDWGAANTGFNGQTLILGASVATGSVDFQNPINLGAATRTVQVDNGTASVDGKLSGVLSGTGGSLTKTGAGTLQLTAANTFTGVAAVSAGTLQLSDGGTLDSASGVTIANGATLSMSNTPATASTNRIQDGAPITMTGGTLAFTHTAGAADYSETFGALTVSNTGNVISASRAASGQTSTLNFASLSYTPGGLQFQGEGLGLSDERNRIFIAGLSAGAIGSGVTYFDGVSSGTAGYSLANGVVLLAPASSVNILGGVIVDNSTSVGIVDGGTSGDITLSSPVTAIQSLAQNATSAGTVDMSGKTLRVQTVVLGSADGSLNLGGSPGSGTLTPAASGGSLTLNNNYGSPTLMTVNAVIANHGPSASLVKTGAGTVRIASGATYSGATDISGGTLALVGAGALADSTAVNLSNAGSVLDISGISASGESIGTLSGVAGSSVVLGGKNLTTLGGGTTFAGVISGAGGSLTHSSLGGTLELTGLNTFTGPVTLGTGAILSVNQLLSSGPQPLGEGTSAITFNGNANDYSALVYTGTVDGFISRELNMASGDGGMISVSDPGVKVTLTGALTGGSNVDFRKDGPGKLVLAGSEDWNGNALVQGGTLVIGDDINPGTNSFSGGTWNISAGATMRINTTGSFESTTITKDGTFRLESGTLRTNTLAGNGDFTWGNATLSTLGNNTMGLVDRTDPAGSPSGPVVREGNVLVYTGALTTGGTSGQGSLLDLGATVLNDGLRYNQISISGALNLSGVDTLNFSVNPYFLRPNTASSVITGDWGSLILVRAASFTGTFDSITGIGNDGIGWRLFTPGQNGDPSFTGAGDLPLNTYYIEYATNSPDSVGVLGGPAILFHYKVAGSVPEPASVGLMIAGALLLRTLSLRRLRSY